MARYVLRRQVAELSLSVQGARSLDELLELVAGAALAIVEADEVAAELLVEGAPALGANAAARHRVRRPADTSLATIPLSAFGDTEPRPVRTLHRRRSLSLLAGWPTERIDVSPPDHPRRAHAA